MPSKECSDIRSGLSNGKEDIEGKKKYAKRVPC